MLSALKDDFILLSFIIWLFSFSIILSQFSVFNAILLFLFFSIALLSGSYLRKNGNTMLWRSFVSIYYPVGVIILLFSFFFTNVYAIVISVIISAFFVGLTYPTIFSALSQRYVWVFLLLLAVFSYFSPSILRFSFYALLLSALLLIFSLFYPINIAGRKEDILIRRFSLSFFPSFLPIFLFLLGQIHGFQFFGPFFFSVFALSYLFSGRIPEVLSHFSLSVSYLLSMYQPAFSFLSFPAYLSFSLNFSLAFFVLTLLLFVSYFAFHSVELLLLWIGSSCLIFSIFLSARDIIKRRYTKEKKATLGSSQTKSFGYESSEKEKKRKRKKSQK